MRRVAEVVSSLGYERVWTFLNSGNVVFDGVGGRADMESSIGAALEDEYGFEVTTFVRSIDEVRQVLRFEPFTAGPGDSHYVVFLRDEPSDSVASALTGASNDVDTLVVNGTEVHWLVHGNSQDTTVKPATWRPFGPYGTTTRNITMLRKLVAKADD